MLWLKVRIQAKAASKVSATSTTLAPQPLQAVSVSTPTEVRPVLVQSAPITGRPISTTGAAEYGADEIASASESGRPEGTSPYTVVVGGAASAAAANTGGPVSYRLVGSTSLPQQQPSAVVVVT